MNSFLIFLKGQATVINMVLFLFILALIFYRYRKRKTAILLATLSFVFLASCSTIWIPRYFAGKMESQYLPIQLPLNRPDTGKVLIFVLGSGYTLDKKLPANAQIGLVALGRLVEGIRIHRATSNSILICSGYSPWKLETQAQVTKKAAIVLGVEPTEIETLDEPSTTQEEVKAFSERYGKSSTVVLVTDALHLSRSMKLLEVEGFKPIAAPTNFKVNDYQDEEPMYWWPSVDNIGLMNYVFHEWLGSLKSYIFH